MFGSRWNDPGPDRGYSWVICGACFWVNFFAGGFRNCQGNLFVLIQRGQDLSREDASWPNTWLSLTSSLSALFSGVLNHYFGWRAVLNALSLIGTVGFVGAYLSPNTILWINIYQSLIGLAMGPVFPTLVKVSSSFFVERRSTAQNIFSAGNPLSSIAFPVILEYVASHVGLHGSWLVMASLYVQSFVFIALLRPSQFPDHNTNSTTKLLVREVEANIAEDSSMAGETKNREDAVNAAQYFRQIKELLEDLKFHIFLLVTTVDFSILMVVFFVIIDHGTDVGLSTSNATMLVVVISLGDCFGRIVAGYFIERKYLSLGKSYGVSCLCQALVYVLIGLAQSTELLFVACFLNGITFCFTAGIRTLMTTNIFGLNKAATITGLMVCLLGGFVALSPPLIGYFREGFGSYSYMFLLFSIVSVALAAMMFSMDVCLLSKGPTLVDVTCEAKVSPQ